MNKFFLLFLFISSAYTSEAQSTQWAKGIGSTGLDYGNAVTTDIAGNIYSTGSFQGTVDFDPGVGVYNLTSAGNADIFVLKLDAAGNFVWVRRMGGLVNDYAYAIALDDSGNIYTTGEFQGNADFDPGPSVFTLSSVFGPDVFISKLSASGDFVWAKKIGGDSGVSIAIDNLGNVLTTGVLYGTDDFDPGPSIFSLTAAGSDDVFISKLDRNGNFLWARSVGGVNNDYSHEIKVDQYCNVYVTGTFYGTADFDPGAAVLNLSSAGYYDVFILKLDSAANFSWAKKVGGDNWDDVYGLAIDTLQNVYLTGSYRNLADFDPGSGVYNLYTPGANINIFILKLDSLGDFIWAKQMGGPNEDVGISIALDHDCNVYSTGYFSGTADFDPGIDTASSSYFGMNDIYISKLDSSGNFIWAKHLGGSGDDNPKCIAIDDSNNVVVIGTYTGTADFNPDAGISNLTSLGQTDLFIYKYYPCFTSSSFVSNASCHGTNDGLITLSLNGGVLPYSYLWSNGDTTQNISELTAGSYSVTITTSNGCLATISPIVLTEPAALVLNITTTADDGSGNGQAFVIASGGFPQYSYLWSNGSVDQIVTGLSAGNYWVIVTDIHGCSDSVSVLIHSSVGIQSNIKKSDSDLSIYPNPSNGKFYISCSDQIDLIEVFNELGGKVIQKLVDSTHQELDLSREIPGIYFVCIKTKNNFILRKILLLK